VGSGASAVQPRVGRLPAPAGAAGASTRCARRRPARCPGGRSVGRRSRCPWPPGCRPRRRAGQRRTLSHTNPSLSIPGPPTIPPTTSGRQRRKSTTAGLTRVRVGAAVRIRAAMERMFFALSDAAARQRPAQPRHSCPLASR
jgi:hypothetical protein